MSQANGDFDEGDGSANDSPGMKQLRAALEKETKARKELETKLAEAEKANRSTTLKQAFEKANVPPGFAKLYEGEPDEKAIKDWWKETAPDFGLTAQDEKQTPEIDPVQAEAARLISQAQQQAPPSSGSSVEALTKQLESMDFGEALAKGLVTQTGVVSHGPVR